MTLVAAMVAGPCLLLMVDEAFATTFARPERHDVFSPNGVFVLDVNPETETHTVYRTSDRSKPLWSFGKRVWLGPFLLSNDGTVVVTLAWKFVQADAMTEKDCIQFRGKDGIFRTYSFREICPNPARTSLVGIGPIGDFWRTWHTDFEQGDTEFSVTTTDLYACRFDMASGDLIGRRIAWGNIRYKPLWWFLAAGILILVVLAARFLFRRWRSSIPDAAQNTSHGARE